MSQYPLRNLLYLKLNNKGTALLTKIKICRNKKGIIVDNREQEPFKRLAESFGLNYVNRID